MNNFKRILILLLSLTLSLTAVFSLVSCGGDDNNDNNNGDNNNNNDGDFNYTVTIVDEDGKGISGVNVFITDDVTVFENKTTDENGKASITLYTENKNIGVMIVSNPAEYETPAEVEPGLHVLFGDSTEATITLTKKVTETVTYTVKVVDQNGNAVEGVTLQICHSVCVQCDATDANGESKKELSKSVSEMTLKVGILTVPEGYTIPEATIDGTYHATIAPGSTTVTVEITKN